MDGLRLDFMKCTMSYKDSGKGKDIPILLICVEYTILLIYFPYNFWICISSTNIFTYKIFVFTSSHYCDDYMNLSLC